MTMEKKAWVEPKVEAVEFQANEYVSTCYLVSQDSRVITTSMLQTVAKNFYDGIGKLYEPDMEDWEKYSIFTVGEDSSATATFGDVVSITDADAASWINSDTAYNSSRYGTMEVEHISFGRNFDNLMSDLISDGEKLYLLRTETGGYVLATGFTQQNDIAGQAVWS